jgi:Skp family chaperone for outer membrane proteins
MNLVELTGLVGAATALVSTVLVPVYLNRRSERRALDREHRRREAELAEGTEVSWEAINRAIVKERDTLKGDLSTQAASHKIELAKLRESHQREMSELNARWERASTEAKDRHDQETAGWAQRLTDCQEQVRRLYGELYELQRLLPPGIARPAEPGTGPDLPSQ